MLQRIRQPVKNKQNIHHILINWLKNIVLTLHNINTKQLEKINRNSPHKDDNAKMEGNQSGEYVHWRKSYITALWIH